MNKRLSFLLLIVLPIVALVKSFASLDWKISLGYLLVVSLITYAAYWHDKRRAQTGGWRIPENTLHLLELLGGWPVAFLAQQVLHHKRAKQSYRILYWLIVAAYQLVAIDYLLNWRMAGSVLGK